jgi:hypothetical protein
MRNPTNVITAVAIIRLLDGNDLIDQEVEEFDDFELLHAITVVDGLLESLKKEAYNRLLTRTGSIEDDPHPDHLQLRMPKRKNT